MGTSVQLISTLAKLVAYATDAHGCGPTPFALAANDTELLTLPRKAKTCDERQNGPFPNSRL